MSNNLKDLINKFSFKRKPIFLELKDYTYKHHPLKPNDKVFVGRDKIIDKLRSFIAESESKSGAYLISGFRGMGKTSLVNKALEIFNAKSNAKRFIYLYVVSLLLLLNYGSYSISLISGGIIIISLIAYYCFFNYLIQSYPRKTKNSKYKLEKSLDIILNNPFRKSKFRFCNIIRTFLITYTYLGTLLILFIFTKITKIHQEFWLGAIYAVFLYLLFNRIRLEFEKNTYDIFYSKLKRFSIYFIVSFFLGLTILMPVGVQSVIIVKSLLVIWSGILLVIKIQKTKSNVGTLKPYQGGLSRIKPFFEFRKHLIVNVNLGKDAINEKDVLKYTTNKLLIEYTKWRKTINHISIVIYRTGPIVLLFFVFSIVANHNPYSEFSKSLVKELNFPRYAVSQVLLEPNIKQEDILEVKDSITNGRLSLSNYIELFVKLDKQKNGSDTTVMYNGVGYWSIEGDEFWESTHRNCALILNITDFYVYASYLKIRETIVGEGQIYILSVLFPYEINYFVIFIIFFIFYLFFKLNIFGRLGIITHDEILSDLKELKEKVEASIVYDKGMNVPLPLPSSGVYKFPIFKSQKTTSYHPLDSKDIEAELVAILEKIDRVPLLFYKIDPIFIYDELDKIVPHSNENLVLKDEETPEQDYNIKIKRQEIISNILSSLKNFITSAKAKFIFIAGRDMYDAALAGISDRQSVLDSIFHDNQIYVNSFYTESHDQSINDISSMTEKFICQFLIPEKFMREQKDNDIPSLRLYREYIDKNYIHLSSRNSDEQKNIEINRVILALSNMITYITYRSNGAPKKIATLFEQFIYPGSNSYFASGKRGDMLRLGDRMDNLHLKLSYYDQYRISFTTYLVNPLFFRLGSYMNEYGDKLLVSISYLMDHIYKYHRFAFSKRNLSLTPEIIEINKEPEFRNFLNEILNDLSISQLRKIISGLHDYRFQSKIRNELTFLTKISPRDTAAFNFTLDESIEIKRFFYKRLRNLKNQYYNSGLDVSLKTDYINSIAFFHMSIGDLHFYDQEYTDAIINYFEAIQTINGLKDGLDLYLFVLLVRNNLKLGLSFEKEGMVQNALMKYNMLSHQIVENRNIPIEEFGLEHIIVKKKKIEDMWDRLKEISGMDDIEKIKKNYWPNVSFENSENPEIKLIGRKVGEETTIYDINGKNIAQNLENFSLNNFSESFHLKITTIENIRLIYQPIIARLHLQEKGSPNGVSKRDIDRAMKEFQFLTRPIATNEANIIVSEFHNKIGDLLYYRNRTVITSEKITSEIVKNTPYNATYFYLLGILQILKSVDSKNELRKSFEKILKLLNKTHLDDFVFDVTNIIAINSNLDEIAQALIVNNIGEYVDNYNQNYVSTLANSVIDFADCYYSSLDHDSTIKQIETLIDLFLLALKLLEEIGEFRLAKSQYLKILYLYLSFNQKLNSTKARLAFNKYCNESINLLHLTYNVSLVPEKKKFDNIITEGVPDPRNYRFTAANHEVREIQLLKWFYKLKIHPHISTPALLEILEYINDYPHISNKNIRILENQIRIEINDKIIGLTNTSEIKNYFNFDSYDTFEQFILLDSIGSCQEIIKIHNLMGKNYVSTGNLTLARAHYKMARLCKKYKDVKNELSQKIKKSTGKELDNFTAQFKNFDINLKLILGSKKLYYIDENYHYLRAKLFNKKAKEMHNQDNEYKNFISNRFYLEDDFNDNLVHFGVARERSNLRFPNCIKIINELVNMKSLDALKLENYR